jgi:hypothetical protein
MAAHLEKNNNTFVEKWQNNLRHMGNSIQDGRTIYNNILEEGC